MDLQAKLREVRFRAESARPNLLPRLGEAVSSDGGPLGFNIGTRARDIARSRPILGQALNGQLLTGASLGENIRSGGFRQNAKDSAVKENIPILPGGFRKAT